MSKYKIEFTEKQLSVLEDALEFYSRFLAGQWEIPSAMKYQEFKNQDKYEGFWDKRNYIEDNFRRLSSNFTGLPINASYGINNSSLAPDASIAYDMYRPIKEEFCKNPSSVYNTPSGPYSEEGRIKIIKIE